MIEEVGASGLGHAFEWFFLSDTTDPEIFVAEEQAFLAMRERLLAKVAACSTGTGLRISIESPAISRSLSPAGAAATRI